LVFEGLLPNQLQIPFIGDPTNPSDIAPIWNPEAFFNTMVVNGVTWPQMEVAPALYRVRLLNGCNSRFLNLSMKPVDPVSGKPISVKKTVWVTQPNAKLKSKSENVKELPFYQIGAEQSLLPKVVMVATGTATPLPGNAERADVILDFRGLPNGTVIQMFNTAPDAPFGGFPAIPADPTTSGQVMRFVVNTALLGTSPTDEIRALDGTPLNPNAATPPESLVLSLPEATSPANGPAVLWGPRRRCSRRSPRSLCVTVGPTRAITLRPDRDARPSTQVPA
jgi:FtsP/CotA-like multicopper oxidase with cupredoxin domain